jgi:large subunit ribosomal protein L24
MMKLKIKKGDNVQVMAGNDKGKVKRVIAVYPKVMRVLVEGVNVRKKHTRPNQNNTQGGIISKEMPIHYSNVQLVDSEKKPTRVGISQEVKDGKRVSIRVAKSNGKQI